MARELSSEPRGNITYGYKKSLQEPFDEAVWQVKEELQKEGFGVLSEINVSEKLKEKVGADFRKYTILGACNPQLAYQALQHEIDIGLLLPCNVVVYADNDSGQSIVCVVKPEQMVGTAGNPALEPIAREADAKLKRVFERLH